MTTAERKQVEAKIQELNDKVAQQITDTTKNNYDPEVNLPKNLTKITIKHKSDYHIANRDISRKNMTRRQNRASTLEQCIIDRNYEEAEKRIRNQYYVSITHISEQIVGYDPKTARRIIKEAFAVIGYEAADIPEILISEMKKLVTQWSPHTKKLYKYHSGKIEPLDLNKKEMICVYDTYLLVKTIILINSTDRDDYEAQINALDKNLTPVYAAIRAYNELT